MNDQPAETTEAAGVRHLRPDGTHCGYYGFVVCNKCGWADPVPASARVAAREATACELGSPGWALLSPNDAIAIALAAAAPHIAAAERERIRGDVLSDGFQATIRAYVHEGTDAYLHEGSAADDVTDAVLDLIGGES